MLLSVLALTVELDFLEMQLFWVGITAPFGAGLFFIVICKNSITYSSSDVSKIETVPDTATGLQGYQPLVD